MKYLEDSLPIRSDPQRLLPGSRSVIAVSLNYNQTVAHTPGYPRIAKYALGRDYHRVMRKRLKRLAHDISEDLPGARFRACVDSAPIAEREYANRAGIGWFGKNTCLIDSRRGSFFFIGLMLTTAELAYDEPSRGGCGTCDICIKACPTGAIVYRDDLWQVDSRRCISYLTIEHRGDIDPALSEEIGDWTFGCDICQDVCPFNQTRESQPLRASSTRMREFLEHRPWPTLLELAEIDEKQWDELTRGSATRRAGFLGLKRNARINTANTERKR